MLQDLGFEICSGGIIGMGESKEDVVDMLLDLKEINPEALPINFLIPIKGTPLQDRDTSNLTPEYCLKVLCLARLLVPTSDIRCAAGREIYFKGREKELLTVVNSIFASGYLTAEDVYKRQLCVCNPLAFGLPRSCTKLLNGLTTIHSLSADVSVRLPTHDLFL